MGTRTPEGTWRKSSYSGNQGNCVEVLGSLDAVRDSKNTGGPALPVAGLRTLVGMIREGRFAR
jgi:hypothetical protein